MEQVTEWFRRTGVPYRERVLGGRLTTFGSGGAVRLVAEPRSEEELTETLSFLGETGVPYRVLGGGSNLLISDAGYDGVVVRTVKADAFSVQGALVTASAGMRLPAFSRKCAALALSGMEFAEGIPGTVGGAVYMNASAFGSGVSDVLESVTLFLGGRTERVSASELPMRYHKGGLPVGSTLLSANFRLTESRSEEIFGRMRLYAEKRAATQPMERSAGSVFARAGDTPAAIYIEETGLKGTRLGGAELSAKHCNFIVNREGATTTDYYALAEKVRREVKKRTGITLDYETEYLC